MPKAKAKWGFTGVREVRAVPLAENSRKDLIELIGGKYSSAVALVDHIETIKVWSHPDNSASTKAPSVSELQAAADKIAQVCASLEVLLQGTAGGLRPQLDRHVDLKSVLIHLADLACSAQKVASVEANAGTNFGARATLAAELEAAFYDTQPKEASGYCDNADENKRGLFAKLLHKCIFIFENEKLNQNQLSRLVKKAVKDGRARRNKLK